MEKAILNWSGGKDCNYALHLFRQQHPGTEIRLLTSISKTTGRVSMHGLRQELIAKQATELGLEIEMVHLPDMPDNATYERLMGRKYLELTEQGFGISIFGDIFLEDLRQYREKQMKELNLKAVFPLWQKNTAEIADEFIRSGFRAVVISTGDQHFGPEVVGAAYDYNFISNLPYGVDPCGENGEFHTFVHDGPGFKNPVDFVKGKTMVTSYPPLDGSESRMSFRFMELLTP